MLFHLVLVMLLMWMKVDVDGVDVDGVDAEWVDVDVEGVVITVLC